MRGATNDAPRIPASQGVSIHAPHAGRDGQSHARASLLGSFNPRAPCGARPAFLALSAACRVFQSTRPMRGATHGDVPVDAPHLVSIHAPHAGRDLVRGALQIDADEFQSTRPMRGATIRLKAVTTGSMFQSTRPMRGATVQHIRNLSMRSFQSTRPMRGATILGIGEPHSNRVSIHAPHAGRDCGSSCQCPRRCSFNPRAPCGARLHLLQALHQSPKVSIHAPHAGRDKAALGLDGGDDVSIHAPHAGRDL